MGEKNLLDGLLDVSDISGLEKDDYTEEEDVDWFELSRGFEDEDDYIFQEKRRIDQELSIHSVLNNRA